MSLVESSGGEKGEAVLCGARRIKISTDIEMILARGGRGVRGATI